MANQGIQVARETVVNNSVVREGNKVFNFSRTANGVSLTVGKTSLTIPNGSLGSAVVSELNAMLGTTSTAGEKVKRTRRTKAEMEAARLAEANGTPNTDGDTAGASQE